MGMIGTPKNSCKILCMTLSKLRNSSKFIVHFPYHTNQAGNFSLIKKKILNLKRAPLDPSLRLHVYFSSFDLLYYNKTITMLLYCII